jgi:hypothetical protein
MRIETLVRAFAVSCICLCAARAATVAPFAAAGYSVLPAPQRVTLRGGEFRLDPYTRLKREGVAANDVAVEALRDDLISRHDFSVDGMANFPSTFTLTLRAGSVAVGVAQDTEKAALAAQAYRIEMGNSDVHITANASAGLFYGVETVAQMIKHRDGALWLPDCEIVDWPDLQSRYIFWDDAHHLERFDELKRAIRQAAFFKINGFVLKLDGHFQFRSAPALVEPQALSPEQLQQLTDYGLRYHVQVIPYLDASAHISFILKHPEYASLRAFPDSNYELNLQNPKSIELLQGMFQDLLDANKGVSQFFLSTDEAYYVGMSDDSPHSEKARQKELGSPGKLLAEFLSKAAGYLHDRGRTVLFWGEFPLAPADVASLPAYLVNAEASSREFDWACRSRGIREMFYLSSSGMEKLFPGYALRPQSRQLHPREQNRPRINDAVERLLSNVTRQDASLMGSIVCGWGDNGLHPETFWLGYATISAAAWNPHDFDISAAKADFYCQFYGPSVHDMDRIYQLMSFQAELWSDSWENGPSESRKKIWGNSHGIHKPRHPARDDVLPLPSAPSPETLAVDSKWTADQSRRLELCEQGLLESDELIARLHENMRLATFNHYNLEVCLAIAQICRHNLNLLRDIGRVDRLTISAHKAATEQHPAEALAALDEAIEIARGVRRERSKVLHDGQLVWYKSWLPRLAEANGRTFLHELDDVKDHLADRTIGMDYLLTREFVLPFGKWVGEIQAARNAYATAHKLKTKDDPFDWKTSEFGTLPEPATSFGAVASDGFLYVYGGHITPTHIYSTAAVSGRFHRLKLSDGQAWEELPGGTGLQGLNLAAYDGKVYRAGGMQPHNAPGEKSENFSVADCLRYDPAAGKWETLPPLPEPRSSHELTVVDGKLFAVGGWTMNGRKGDNWLDTMAMLDLKSAKPLWQSIKQPFKRRAMTAASYDGKLYIMGGFTDEDEPTLTVEIYDPATGKWSHGPDLPGPAGNGFAPAACTLGGSLFVSVADGTLYRLDKGANGWTRAGSSTPRIVHRLVPDGLQILVLGGSTKGDTQNLIEAIPVPHDVARAARP